MNVTGTAPAGATNVGVWKGSRFTTTKFPVVGQPIPASPDATQAQAGAGPFSITTPTDEGYWVGVSDASNKVVAYFLAHYTPSQYQARQDFSGPGAPPASFKPPDGTTWTSSTAQAAGSRFYVCWGGVWTATAA